MKKGNKKHLLFLLAIIASPSAFADVGQQIINVIAHGDIAGENNHSLLSTISLLLNTIALSVMAWLAAIGFSNFVIQTANKGVPGGQVISSFWMPIRIATATIMLIPLSSGYSTLQYGVIAVAEKGVEVANNLAATGIDYIAENGTHIPPIIADSSQAVLGWITSETCSQYINSYQGGDYVTATFRTESGISSLKSLYSYDYKELQGSQQASDPRQAYCGALTIDMPVDILPDNASHSYIAPKIIQSRFSEIISDLKPQVEKIAGILLVDQAALKELQQSGSAAQPAFEAASSSASDAAKNAASLYVNLVREYNSRVRSLAAQAVDEIDSSTAGVSWQDEIKRLGWPALGTYYWSIQKKQERINGLAKSLSASYRQPAPDSHFNNDERFIEISLRIRGLQKFAAEIEKTPDTQIVSVSYAGADGSGDFIKKFFADISSSMSRSFFFDDGMDAMTSLQFSGSVLNSVVDSGFHAVINGAASANAAKDVAHFTGAGLSESAGRVPFVGSIFGAGATVASATAVGATSYFASVVSGYAEMAKAALVPIMIAGFVLAVVLPLLPMFVWVMGVVSWMMFFIECLFVSPFWLAAHGTAEREGWGSEHTRQGYMLMIGLFLSPILRVAGFFAIFLALQPIFTLLQWIFSAISGVVISGWISVGMIVLSPLLVAFTAYSIAVRIFTLPSELFERGLRWINGGQEVTGDSGAESHNRTLVATFSDRAGGTAQAKLNAPGVKPVQAQNNLKSPGNGFSG